MSEADTGSHDGAGLADRIRALSFNVRYDTSADGDRAWGARRERVASVVRFHRPGLVGLQEPLAHQFDDVRAGVPGYEWVGVGRENGGEGGEFGPVGYRADRFERLESGTFWLSETPDVAGSTDWGSARPRMCTWVRLRDDRTDETPVVANTHLDHRSADARERGAALLRRRLGDVAGDDPVILCGDLNATPGSLPLSILTDREAPGRPLRDAGTAATHPHHGPATTFDWFTGDPDRRIDYVLVTPDVEVHQFGVLNDRWEEGVPSDHRPVLADLSLPAADPDAT